VQSSSTMGFIFGAYPPGQMLGLETAGQALLNMLRAHTAAYRAIKALPGGERHKVGRPHTGCAQWLNACRAMT
jgi:beta-glucosidase/6-phospho-beta-glucosidase/beta-galactosidase